MIRRTAVVAFVLSLVALTSSGARRRAVEHPGPSAPHANADSYSVARGQTLTVAAANGVLANDTDSAGKTLSATVAARPVHGALTLNADGSFTYTNDGSTAASDVFTYMASDGTSASAPATVTITVTDNAPVATDDAFSTASGTALVVPAPGVFANDTLNGAILASYGPSGVEQSSIGSATATSQGGSIVLGADGSFTYTPAAGFAGTDTFRYVLRNSGGSSSATVTITVQAPAITAFSVTSPGFFYAFNGISGENPVITLKRGTTVTFSINTSSIHPFEILDAPAGSVTNNNISSGTITFKVPLTATNYRYICSIHGFGNTIVTVP